jgi:hypothetical protein
MEKPRDLWFCLSFEVIVFFGIAYADLFGYGQDQFPMMYLGTPTHYWELTIAK